MTSGKQPILLRQLYSLRPASRAELAEHPARMCFHGILADVDALSDLPRAEAGRDEVQDLELTRRDAEGGDFGFINLKRRRYGNFDSNGDLAYDDLLPPRGYPESDPDAGRREYRGNERSVDLDRMFDDKPPVFNRPERDDEQPADESIEDYVSGKLRLTQRYSRNG